MLNTLIELGVELVPVTVKSLKNSFDNQQAHDSGRYSEYGIFLANNRMGGFMTGYINKIETTVYFMRYPYRHKKEKIEPNDQVVIVCICNKDKRDMWQKPFTNSRYCLGIGDYTGNQITIEKCIKGDF